MRFYGSGEKGKPVIFLFPGTCCLWTITEAGKKESR